MAKGRETIEKPAAPAVPAVPSGWLRVTAQPGKVCPKELSRERIGQTPVLVPENTYYQRLVAEGSLITVKQEG